ncbi:MAG: hypothetical protein Fur002_08200 [Anaerolineales bacterium]
MQKSLSGIGNVFQTPLGVIIAADVVWHLVAYFMGIQVNYALSALVFFIDIAAAYFILDRLIYFFAQFVLPIQNPAHRAEIYARVKGFESGSRGPALFIQNGELIAEEGEEDRSGPGVIVLDTASAGVLRTDTEYKDTIGPGVKFTKPNEYLEGWVDLRPQWQYIGPDGDGKDTAATTRDEANVKATISIKFHIRRPSVKKPTESGVISQYGYDEDAVRRAITQQFVETEGDHKSLISWEHTPADMVVGLWREYVSKFTITELFSVLPESEENGLQRIERMMNKRAASSVVQKMDGMGNLTSEAIESGEYVKLQEHGLEITEIRIHNVHLEKMDEDKILESWNPEWVKNISQQEKELNETDAWIDTMAREESSKRLARLLARAFDGQAPAQNPFKTLEALIKPMKEFILNQSAAGSDMEARLKKLNDIWKWLLDNDAEFSRPQGGSQP